MNDATLKSNASIKRNGTNSPQHGSFTWYVLLSWYKLTSGHLALDWRGFVDSGTGIDLVGQHHNIWLRTSGGDSATFLSNGQFRLTAGKHCQCCYFPNYGPYYRVVNVSLGNGVRMWVTCTLATVYAAVYSCEFGLQNRLSKSNNDSVYKQQAWLRTEVD